MVSDPVGSGVIFAGAALGASTPDYIEMRIVKIDGEDGNTTWTNTYDMGLDLGTRPIRAITTDRVGNIYVTGAWGTFLPQNLTTYGLMVYL
jgi:hypothetical protein